MRMFRLAVKRIEKIVVSAERVSDLLEARLRRRLAGLRQKSIEAFGAVSQVQHAKDRAQQDKPCQAGQERFPRPLIGIRGSDLLGKHDDKEERDYDRAGINDNGRRHQEWCRLQKKQATQAE